MELTHHTLEVKGLSKNCEEKNKKKIYFKKYIFKSVGTKISIKKGVNNLLNLDDLWNIHENIL